MRFKTILKYFFSLLVTIALGLLSVWFRASQESYFSFQGKTIYNQVEVGTYSNGTIKEVLIEEGQIVDQDSKLFEIENEIMTEKFSKMNPQSANFSEPDYVELKKKIDNFVITAPLRAIVFKVLKYKGSFVKDNETIANLIPLETIKYTFELNENALSPQEKDEMMFLTKTENIVILRFSETYEIEGTIKSIVPDITFPNKKIVYIEPKNEKDITVNTAQSFEVRIKRDNKTYFERQLLQFLQ
jgi:multidrug resistance efflux pump